MEYIQGKVKREHGQEILWRTEIVLLENKSVFQVEIRQKKTFALGHKSEAQGEVCTPGQWGH